jgi:hypothetical protein
MDALAALLETFNSLSPLAIIGMLGTAIVLLIKSRNEVSGKVDTVANNHLHELPEAVEILRRMESTLQRIEVKMSEDFSYIRARLNGHGK